MQCWINLLWETRLLDVMSWIQITNQTTKRKDTTLSLVFYPSSSYGVFCQYHLNHLFTLKEDAVNHQVEMALTRNRRR